MTSKSLPFWVLSLIVLVLACQASSSAQGSFCQRVTMDYPTRRPFCAEYVPAVMCNNDMNGGFCCDNTGYPAACSPGCGSVMQVGWTFGCDGHHRCYQARLDYQELLRNPDVIPMLANVFVPDCGGGFASLEHIQATEANLLDPASSL